MPQLLSLQAPPVHPHPWVPALCPAHHAARVGTYPSKMVMSQGYSAEVIKATAKPGPDPNLSSGKGVGRGNQGLSKATRGPRGGTGTAAARPTLAPRPFSQSAWTVEPGLPKPKPTTQL